MYLPWLPRAACPAVGAVCNIVIHGKRIARAKRTIPRPQRSRSNDDQLVLRSKIDIASVNDINEHHVVHEAETSVSFAVTIDPGSPDIKWEV